MELIGSVAHLIPRLARNLHEPRRIACDLQFQLLFQRQKHAFTLELFMQPAQVMMKLSELAKQERRSVDPTKIARSY